jgi:ribose transport system ATP-binding protein
MIMEVLRLEGISKRFSGIQALSKFNFELLKGEVHALIGENGAGKTTLMNIITGVLPKDEGKVWLKGKRVSISSPHEAKNLGISIIYQEMMLIPKLSAVANVFLGAENSRLSLLQNKDLLERYRILTKEVGIYIPPRMRIENLSISQQQMVQILKALSARTEIIIMDEPTSSLTGAESKQLFDWINKLKREGKSIIYISHKINEVLDIADRVTIIRDGKNVVTKENRDLSHDIIVELMIGYKLMDEFPQKKKLINKERRILELRNLTKRTKFENISFNLRKGEILGLYGLVGSGQSDIASAIYGACDFDTGDILLEGRRVKIGSPRDAIRNGIVMVPEDRKIQGLIMEMSTLKNITLTNLDEYVKGSVLNRKAELSAIRSLVEVIGIHQTALRQRVKELSGGNQQKTVFAKWINNDFKIMILSEPARGIDVGSKSHVFHLIGSLAESGKAFILVSSEINEILGMCDRIVVIHDGKIKGEFGREESTEEKIKSLIEV